MKSNKTLTGIIGASAVVAATTFLDVKIVEYWKELYNGLDSMINLANQVQPPLTELGSPWQYKATIHSLGTISLIALNVTACGLLGKIYNYLKKEETPISGDYFNQVL